MSSTKQSNIMNWTTYQALWKVVVSLGNLKHLPKEFSPFQELCKMEGFVLAGHTIQETHC